MMVDLTVAIIFSTIIAILTYVYTKFSSKKLLLPTCPGYPIIGSVTHLDKNRPDKTFIKWGEELGPVYAVKLLHKTIIVVSGYDELHEMLITKGSSFAGRQRRSFLADIKRAIRKCSSEMPTKAIGCPCGKLLTGEYIITVPASLVLKLFCQQCPANSSKSCQRMRGSLLTCVMIFITSF